MPTQFETITEKDLLLKDAQTQLLLIMDKYKESLTSNQYSVQVFQNSYVNEAAREQVIADRLITSEALKSLETQFYMDYLGVNNPDDLQACGMAASTYYQKMQTYAHSGSSDTILRDWFVSINPSGTENDYSFFRNMSLLHNS